MVDIVSDKKASDIVLLDLRGLTFIADYFVICSGASERQIQAITSGIEEKLNHDDRVIPLHLEGTNDSGWVLMDYGGVIVHVFSPEVRDYYKIEKIWSDATTVLRML